MKERITNLLTPEQKLYIQELPDVILFLMITLVVIIIAFFGMIVFVAPIFGLSVIAVTTFIGWLTWYVKRITRS